MSTHGAYLGLDPEFGVGKVLASAPGNRVVDDELFAMVAQVEAAADQRPDEPADGERDARVDPRLAHIGPMRRANEAARSQRIGEKTDLDAPLGCADQCVLDADAIVIGKPDVEAQVDARLCRVDIVDHHAYRSIPVWRECCAVPRGWRQAIYRLCEREGGGIGRRRKLAPDVVLLRWMRQMGFNLAIACASFGADACLAEEEISHHPNDRRGKRCDQPGDT